MKSVSKILFVLLFLAISAHAKSVGQQAHTHGVAALMLVVENGIVEAQFESPSVNLIGFEHKAYTAEEKAAVKQVKRTLENAKSLFAFSGTQCNPIESIVNVDPLMVDEDDFHGGNNLSHNAENKRHDHTSHSNSLPKGHVHHNDSENIDAHAVEVDGFEKNSAHKTGAINMENTKKSRELNHSEITASFRFICKKQNKLTAFTFDIFNLFPGVEKVEVMWVAGRGQGADLLTPGNISVTLE